MKTRQTRFLCLLGGMLLSIGSAQSAFADDTELFISPNDPGLTGAQPNILFIMDTSGSMTNDVVTQVAWDPNQTFSGCYDSSAIYWSYTNNAPGCGSNNYFWKSKFHCKAAETPLQNVGQFYDDFAAWRGGSKNKWVAINANRKNRRHECRDDRGVHGENDGDPDTYAVNGGNGPWHDSAGNEPAWNDDYYVYDGNWLNWNQTGGTVTKDRIDVVKEVASNLLYNLNGVNVGLMRFNRNEVSGQSGGPVVHAIEDIATARQDMLDAVDALPASGWTPLSETLYEANQYWTGSDVVWGNADSNTPDSVAESRVGGVMSSDTYEDPVEFACQKNYQILLTDGAPTRDTDSENAIEALPGFSALYGSDCDGSGSGSCLDDLAGYMFQNDLEPGLNGTQNVRTYTIGFTVDLDLLQDTADEGGGEYKLADDTASLTTALTQIVNSILEDSTTFTAPSVPVNAFNRTQNLNDVFVSLFQPTGSRHWQGNLKKYKLKGGQLVGQDDQPAVDPDSGFFSDTAYSYWSAAPDGDLVAKGGAAHEIPVPSARTIYTNLGGWNTVTSSNGTLTPAILGVPDPMDTDTRDDVIDHMLGYDLTDEDDDGDTNDTRYAMGDPLHVRPVTVIYGGSQTAPDATIFVSTNDGFLHAIDGNTGQEKWAFVPERLLDNMYELYTDPVTANKEYGLDGSITATIVNNDFVPGITGSEQVIIVFGMRRGGDSWYAIDVTDPDAPIFLWDKNSADGDYATLGQSWSTPSIAKINDGGTVRYVAVVGGGYDDAQDNPGYQTDSVGNDLYLIDLLTGDRIWSASQYRTDMNLPMEHSIPSRVNVIDITGDGLANRMYVGDMGGRLWRFDINNGAPRASLIDGGAIASLGAADDPAANTPDDVRRFYAAPDVVAVLAENDQADSYLAINIGSGHRAHPLDTGTADYFFSVRDYAPFDTILTGNYPTEPVFIDDLVDVSVDIETEVPYDAKGWKVALIAGGASGTGEKVVTESFTFQGTVFFTSFAPPASGDPCEARLGLNRLYRVNVTNGYPEPPDGPLGPEPPDGPEDRYSQLQQGGIAPGPVFFFTEKEDGDGSDPDYCVGVECGPSGIDNDYTRTYWFQNETQ